MQFIILKVVITEREEQAINETKKLLGMAAYSHHAGACNSLRLQLFRGTALGI